MWSTVPYVPSVMTAAYAAETHGTELILKNEAATAHHVSEMSLNITKFSAIDEYGNEHFIIDFPGQNPVTFRGIASGNFIRSKSVLSLPQGKYKAFRFYTAGWGNQFIYRDGVAESANSFNRLDFQIENGFTVEEGNAPEVKLWFDFSPYQWKRHFKPLTDLFIGSKSQKPRLANSFGN